jgi:hypothetical protein
MRRALLVGIDAYWCNPLDGCVADAVAKVLRTDTDGSLNWRPELRMGDGSGTDSRVSGSTQARRSGSSTCRSKEPYVTEWKRRVRTRVRRSDGVIALIGSNTLKATGELGKFGA